MKTILTMLVSLCFIGISQISLASYFYHDGGNYRDQSRHLMLRGDIVHPSQLKGKFLIRGTDGQRYVILRTYCKKGRLVKLRVKELEPVQRGEPARVVRGAPTLIWKPLKVRSRHGTERLGDLVLPKSKVTRLCH